MIKKEDIPQSWSSLTWQQLCQMWTVKQRFGGNADVARAAALLDTLPQPIPESEGSGYRIERGDIDPVTGEQQYLFTPLHAGRGRLVFTPRELAHMAKESLKWFDYPYGDQGEREEKDEKGKVVKKRREAVSGYVSPMRDAMILPEEEVVVWHRHFTLPQMAMNNITWQQYRALQAIAPQLFQDGIGEQTALSLQAQFLAHILVPRSFALFDSTGRTIKLRPHYVYEYDADRAERMEKWWEKTLSRPLPVRAGSSRLLRWLPWFRNRRRDYPLPSMQGGPGGWSVLFHIMFQCYQTALSYYAAAYPLLFQDSGKQDPLRDALTGEVGTINTIMKYAGYAEQQQVYDSNLPFVLDILNTMTKEANEIEKMNAKIKRK